MLKGIDRNYRRKRKRSLSHCGPCAYSNPFVNPVFIDKNPCIERSNGSVDKIFSVFFFKWNPVQKSLKCDSAVSGNFASTEILQKLIAILRHLVHKSRKNGIFTENIEWIQVFEQTKTLPNEWHSKKTRNCKSTVGDNV